MGDLQGSILGPLLFSLYAGDLATITKYSSELFYTNDKVITSGNIMATKSHKYYKSYI